MLFLPSCLAKVKLNYHQTSALVGILLLIIFISILHIHSIARSAVDDIMARKNSLQLTRSQRLARERGNSLLALSLSFNLCAQAFPYENANKIAFYDH